MYIALFSLINPLPMMFQCSGIVHFDCIENKVNEMIFVDLDR